MLGGGRGTQSERFLRYIGSRNFFLLLVCTKFFSFLHIHFCRKSRTIFFFFLNKFPCNFTVETFFIRTYAIHVHILGYYCNANNFDSIFFFLRLSGLIAVARERLLLLNRNNCTRFTIKRTLASVVIVIYVRFKTTRAAIHKAIYVRKSFLFFGGA